jgi:excisionase family DNA binding protein
MSTTELETQVLNGEELQLAKTAQRCIVHALDHSRARKIVIVDEAGEGGDVLEVPVQALRFFADILGMMSQGKLVSIVPQKLELTTQEAAAFLNVSRPFLIKQLENNVIKYRKIGAHRRIAFDDLVALKASMQRESKSALQNLIDLDQEMGLE